MRTIRRIIKYWLEHPPARQFDLAAHRHLLLDGTYIDGRKGIFAVSAMYRIGSPRENYASIVWRQPVH